MGSRLEKNSTEVRKRIQNHTFDDEQGEEYQASKYGGFADYMRRKKIKLQNLDAELRAHTEHKPPIFRGIVIHVNGYTQPSLGDLHTLVVSHGGGFLQYLEGKTAVTHVVATHLTPKKRVEFARYRIVKPAWIVDSVKAGKLLAWDSYRLVDEGATQKVLSFEGGQVTTQSNQQRHSYRKLSTSDQDQYQTRSDDEVTNTHPTESKDQMENLQLTGHPDPPSEDDLLSKDVKTIQSDETDLLGSSHTYSSDGIADLLAEADDFDRNLGENLDTVDTTAANLQQNERNEGVSGPGKENNPGANTIEVKVSPEKRQLTAEEHNAILLSNPHLAKSSTANPDFINQYYRESRLHHLSTWKSELKAQLQARAQAKSSSQKNQHKRSPGARRYIMHVDFDSFFAAVSLRKNPQLIDKPVVIAHGSGPGSEIASCNYPARKYGVKNGMWMKTALGLCSELNVLPYDFKAYEEASRHFYDAILSVDGIVQSISIDEALVDVSDQCIKAGGSDGRAIQEGSIYREQERAQDLGRKIRESVKEKTGCDVSVGIGNNILLAKAALRKAKPAGQHIVKPEEILEFLGDLLVTDLPGVAWSIGNKMEEIGVKYVKDIRNFTKERLVTTLGPKTGEKIWDYSRGIDKQEVGEQVVRKSVSAEINWGIRFINQQQAEEFVQCLSDELSKRLLDQLVKGRQLTMKIMRKSADAGMDPPKNLGHGKCDTFNKSFLFGVATNDKNVIGKEAVSMLRSYGFPPGELRGLGVQMQKLEALKPALNVNLNAQDSSQRRLQFKRPDEAQIMAKNTISLSKPNSNAEVESPETKDTANFGDDIQTPEKVRSEEIVSGVLQYNMSDVREDLPHKPLNIGGTQFVMPTQVDQAVLQDLPQDIRQKLAPKQRSIASNFVRLEIPQESKSRSASPYLSDNEIALPNQSQLDPDIIAALPEDVRDELLAHYRNSGSTDITRPFQKIHPQSPRKINTSIGSNKQPVTPTKKNKAISALTKGRLRSNDYSTNTLTQTNFLSGPKFDNTSKSEQIDLTEEISQSFLEELPDDIRLEILAEQKRNRMKSKSGLDMGTNKKRPKINQASEVDSDAGQQRLHLATKAPRPTFTSKKLSSVPELREAMTSWVHEFSDFNEDGPFREDVDALAKYLSKVILDERDMAKALDVVNWVSYLVEKQTSMDDQLQATWHNAINIIQTSVQLAVQKRGLPPVEFTSFIR